MKNILLIDDDLDILEMVSLLLTNRGYAVHCAENGKEALEYLHTVDRKPCIILLDMMMPIMGGQEFMEHLVEEDMLVSLPVVVTSASSSVSVAGARKYLRKPYGIDALIPIIEEHCGAGKKEETSKAVESAVAI